MDQKELLNIIEEAAKKGSTELDMSKKGITMLPPEIGKLTSLQTLNLWDNRLTTLPPEIVQLTGLQRLNLRGNQLTTLPPEIVQLTSLRNLTLWDNQFTTLPPEIVQLTSLYALYLAGNRLTTLPPEIAQLTGLQTLDLSHNQLTMLPPEIGKLTSLQTLDLRGNQLTTLPPEIGKLTSLQTLNLWDNRLTTLPPEIIQLTSLQTMDLDGNRLTTLPPEIGKLTSLQTLYFSRNQLTTLPPEIGKLTNLRELHLHSSQLTTLPPEIVQLTNLQTLDLEGNPLVSPPPEIAKQGMEAVRSYFASLEKARVLNEVKVILVGDGGAGKTSLVNRLLRDEFDENESKTQGIKKDDWPVSASGAKICAHIWDFGGQDIMHSTHQFFLSKRSLYVLVLDGRKEEDAEYWLKSIESFGGDSPILVALNKMDENPGFDVNRRFLQGKYKGIQGFFRISCKSGKGIQALKGALIKSLSKVEIRSMRWPENWFNVKQRLEKMERCFIDEDEYTGMCEAAKIPGEKDRDTLVRFLHDLGVIVHFHEFALKHMHVLNPKWLTAGVYRIINSEELANNNGILQISALGGTLASNVDGFSFPKREHPYIVNIMEKFELCFHIDTNTILIPDLLEVQEPEIDFDYDSSLRFRIDYDFLPKSIIPRFIVKKHAEIKGGLCWRTGVVLKSGAYDATAVVRADKDAKRIYIYVAGSQRGYYLTVLRSVFLEINSGFEKLEYTERMPLPDDPDVTVRFQYLLELEKDGTPEFRPEEGGKRRYRVKELLGTVHIEPSPTVEDFFRLLHQIAKNTDEISEISKKADRLLELQPGILAQETNVDALTEGYIRWSIHLEQSRIDSECPSVFVVRPRGTSKLMKAIKGKTLDLQLYCEAPGKWHPTDEGGCYRIDEPAQWLKTTEPYIRRMVDLLKRGAPLAAAFAAYAAPQYTAPIANDIKLMVELVKLLPDIKGDVDYGLARFAEEKGAPQGAVGAALRGLFEFLKAKDHPARHWGGLRKVATQEGFLWLCERHAEEYAS